MKGSAVENSLREAALFLVSTIYTSIRNNDGCHRTEQKRELLDVNAPGSLMEPIFNSVQRHFLFILLISFPLSLYSLPLIDSFSPFLSNFLSHTPRVTFFLFTCNHKFQKKKKIRNYWQHTTLTRYNDRQYFVRLPGRLLTFISTLLNQFILIVY